MRQTRQPNFESGGRGFESLRARHYLAVRPVSDPDTWVTDYSGDMGNTFGGILSLCNPYARSELSPFSQEGHTKLGTPKPAVFARSDVVVTGIVDSGRESAHDNIDVTRTGRGASILRSESSSLFSVISEWTAAAWIIPALPLKT